MWANFSLVADWGFGQLLTGFLLCQQQEKKIWLNSNKYYINTLNRTKLYVLLSIGCLAGYVWLYINFTPSVSSNAKEIDVCLIKHITDVPCPSCGSTRAALSMLHGNFQEAISWNPIGIFLLLIMIISPLWIIFDILLQKSTLYSFYKKGEYYLQQVRFAAPAIMIIIANWIWNIYKHI